MLEVSAAGRGISREEGDQSLMPSSILLMLLSGGIAIFQVELSAEFLVKANVNQIIEFEFIEDA